MVTPLSLLPSAVAILVALLTAFVLSRWFGGPPKAGRFASIDGLRGYLAFFVFLHHSSIWYFYLNTGSWRLPPSNIYTNFGQSSVAVFFMITGFLFYDKIFNERHNGTDWLKLFVSRVLRLTPLYLFTITLLFIIVAVLSSFQLNDSRSSIIQDLLSWLTFTMFGAPDINSVKNTSIIVSAVTWSLPYEWLFYLTLPMLALTTGRVATLPYLLVGVVGVVGFVALSSSPWYLCFFVGGIAAALLVRQDRFCKFATTRAATFLILIAAAVSVTYFPSAYAPAPLALLLLAFALIAGGNSLFGLFLSQVSRTLGEMAYSIYLLHGLLLFVIFRFLVGFERAAQLTATMHWLLVILATPVLVTTCFFTFRFIEQPAMRQSNHITSRIKTLCVRKGSATAGMDVN